MNNENTIIQEFVDIVSPLVAVKFQHDEPVRNKLLLTIWTLATKESYREVASRFSKRDRSNETINNVIYIFKSIYNTIGFIDLF